jgi:eukaryotic-like serine/threonine-protein kinase
MERGDIVAERFEIIEVAGKVEYAFCHGLMQNAAYATLTEVDRKLGHRLAGAWLAEAGEREARVLAGHFELGGDEWSARMWLVRAAAQALEANDFHTVVAHATRAIDLGATGDVLRAAHEVRGAAHMGLGTWLAAPKELRSALALVPADHREHRADLHLKLARACFFGFDVEGLRENASTALALASELDRPDFSAEAIAGLGTYAEAAGDLGGAIDAYARAKQSATGRYFSFEAQLFLALLWRGDVAQAIERGRAFVDQARSMNDIYALMVALPQVGLSLVAGGRYAEAQTFFDQARDVGRRHDTRTLVARAIAMSAGYHQDLFDFAGALRLASEANEMALSASYPPTVVSTSLDLLVHAARVGDIGRAERDVAAAREQVAKTAGQGWHGWLFKMRLAAALAEIARAKGDAEAALEHANDVVAQSGACGRIKYQVIGHVLRGQALALAGRRSEAIASLEIAFARARKVADPALVLRAGSALLGVEGDDALLRSVQAAAERMRVAMPEPLRAVFDEADVVRRVRAVR